MAGDCVRRLRLCRSGRGGSRRDPAVGTGATRPEVRGGHVPLLPARCGGACARARQRVVGSVGQQAAPETGGLARSVQGTRADGDDRRLDCLAHQIPNDRNPSEKLRFLVRLEQRSATRSGVLPDGEGHCTQAGSRLTTAVLNPLGALRVAATKPGAERPSANEAGGPPRANDRRRLALLPSLPDRPGVQSAGGSGGSLGVQPTGPRSVQGTRLNRLGRSIRRPLRWATDRPVRRPRVGSTANERRARDAGIRTLESSALDRWAGARDAERVCPL